MVERSPERRPDEALPPLFAGWFRSKGWAPHRHQIAMIEAVAAGKSALLIAPTGGGKTLAGFLPSLIDLAERPLTGTGLDGLHTLYVSPLKALAVDIHRNLEQPVAEMRLPLRLETRTGDTPQAKRDRQLRTPPQLLLTTPESLALLLAQRDGDRFFRHLKFIVADELHALAGGKRGDQLALCLARLTSLAPQARRIGLSATVAYPDALLAYLSARGRADAGDVALVSGSDGAEPRIDILRADRPPPWSGHMAGYAVKAVYERIAAAGTTLVFVNTRAQAEILFQALWRINEDNLPIALHHGSLAVEQRRKVEKAMAEGGLRAVVATSSLDLGIDWAGVDLVVQIGAPKGVSRLLQRIGRANHRMDTPSRALLVPGNRFEILECRAALEAIRDMTLDGAPPGPGGLDVLAQHILGRACAGPFDGDHLYAEIRRAAPYADLTRNDFDRVLDYVATGGYALAAYERYGKLKQDRQGQWHLAHPAMARRYRMNVGTIVEPVTLKVRLRRGSILGEVEETFANGLRRGDTFMFAGRLLCFEEVRETFIMVTPGGDGDPAIPAYGGSRLPFTTHLSERVREMLENPRSWGGLPEPVLEWLRLQLRYSVLPPRDGLLVETFPRTGKFFMVAYCFEGRNAHQTLGMLLTRRMERMGLNPLGFVASDYVIAVWSLAPLRDADALFDEDMLGDDLEAWMDESSLMKRTFRNVAIIAGLIERRHPGQDRKTARQILFNTNLIYDTLRRHDPTHVLLEATRADAAKGMTDLGRLAGLLARAKGRIIHRHLDRISPLAVPILLEVGREQVYGQAIDALLLEAEDMLVREAMPDLAPGQSELPLPYAPAASRPP